jgi:hypothetical protein
VGVAGGWWCRGRRRSRWSDAPPVRGGCWEPTPSLRPHGENATHALMSRTRRGGRSRRTGHQHQHEEEKAPSRPCLGAIRRRTGPRVRRWGDRHSKGVHTVGTGSGSSSFLAGECPVVVNRPPPALLLLASTSGRRAAPPPSCLTGAGRTCICTLDGWMFFGTVGWPSDRTTDCGGHAYTPTRFPDNIGSPTVPSGLLLLFTTPAHDVRLPACLPAPSLFRRLGKLVFFSTQR